MSIVKLILSASTLLHTTSTDNHNCAEPVHDCFFIASISVNSFRLKQFLIYLFIDGLKKIGPAVRRHKHNYTLITPKHTQRFKQDRIQSFVLALPVDGPS